MDQISTGEGVPNLQAPQGDVSDVHGRPIVKKADAIEKKTSCLKKLFVGHLNVCTNEKTLKVFFERFGDVEDAYVAKGKCYGFVTFKLPWMVDQVMARRPHYLDGQELEVKRAMGFNSCGREIENSTLATTVLYVGDLPDDATENELGRFFAEYGFVSNVKLVPRHAHVGGDKPVRSYAYVHFQDYDPVDKIVLLDEHYFLGQRIQVSKKAPPRGRPRYPFYPPPPPRVMDNCRFRCFMPQIVNRVYEFPPMHPPLQGTDGLPSHPPPQFFQQHKPGALLPPPPAFLQQHLKEDSPDLNLNCMIQPLINGTGPMPGDSPNKGTNQLLIPQPIQPPIRQLEGQAPPLGPAFPVHIAPPVWPTNGQGVVPANVNSDVWTGPNGWHGM